LTKPVLNIIQKFILCLRSRLGTPFTYSLASVTGLLVAYRGLPPLKLALLLTTSTAFVSLSVYLYNDLMDLEDDKRGMERGSSTTAKRPLQSGIITKNEMALFVVFSASMGLISASLINVNVLFLEAFLLLLGVAYSTEPVRLKKRFLIKQGTVALGFVISTMVACVAVGVFSWRVAYIAYLYVVFSFSISPIFDLKDIEEDRVSGIRTIPVVWGPDNTFRLSIAIWVSTILAGVLGYSRMGFNIVLPIFGTMILALIIYVVYPLRKQWVEEDKLMNAINRKFMPLHFILQLTVVIASLPIAL